MVHITPRLLGSMCVSPRLVKNPYRKLSGKGLNYLHDDLNYTYVPCGVCPECLATKQLSVVQRLEIESSYSVVYCLMFSYQDKFLPEMCLPTGEVIRCFRRSDIQNMFYRIRHSGVLPSFKFFYVSEYGGKHHRPHYHMMIFFPDNPDYISPLFQQLVFDTFLNEWRINLGSRRSPVYEPLLIYKKKFVGSRFYRNFDVQLLNKSYGQDVKAAFYNSKYCVKSSAFVKYLYALVVDSHDGDKDSAYSDLRLCMPFRQFSHNFGLPDKNVFPDLYSSTVDMLRRSISLSISNRLPYPHYYSPFNPGFSAPLARFYYNNPDIVTFDDAVKFIENGKNLPINRRTLEQAKNSKAVYQSRCRLIDGRLASDSLVYD